MDRREIVRRAIEFDNPPRLPFWQHSAPSAPDGVCDIWEMDRAGSTSRQREIIMGDNDQFDTINHQPETEP
jgi:hypothetical protein